ncbi:hypothetical protein GCM10023258_11610 [Terrabacter aeriphilus]|uniref:Phosphotransferase enzyme family protein n=1 Tax=Terrabacter aeriphilus TaxID=515662 RepID=A0ABP9J688_9MICO
MSSPDVAAPPERRTAQEVADQLHQLWPDAAGVVVRSRRAARSHAVSFVPLPSASRPRLLTPATPHRVAAAAVRSTTTPTGLRDRAVLAVAGAAARWGLLRLHPHRVVVDGNDAALAGSLPSRLGRQLGADLVPSFYVGPVRAVQKPVIRLHRADGSSAAFAKVGSSDFTDALVAREAAALRVLGDVPWTTLRVPRLLAHQRWNGHDVLVQTALSSDGPADLDLSLRALRELVQAGEVVRTSLADSVWWHELGRRTACLPDHPAADVLRRAVEALEALAPTLHVSQGRAHLDWAPWNMGRSGDVLSVWDWEQFSEGVPVGYDAVHYAVQDLVVLEQAHPVAAFATVRRQAPRLVERLGLSPAEGDLVVLLYVLDLASRYLEDGETGTRLSRLDGWLATVLSSFPLTAAAAS